MASTQYKTQTKSSRPVIPTPPTASEELHNEVVSKMTAHFSNVLTPTVMIANRKGAYATVINATYDNVPLEQLLGTVNAKVATEQVLTAISAGYSAVSSK